MIGLGWEMKPGTTVDLDASVFILNTKLKLPTDEHFVFYNNLRSPDGSIQHTGDNRTGFGDDDDEMILCNLDLIDNAIFEILIAVTIHEAEARGHSFGSLKDAYVRLYDVENKTEISKYDLDEKNPTDVGMIFGKLQKQDNDWRFIAVGEGNGQSGLQGFVDKYI